MSSLTTEKPAVSATAELPPPPADPGGLNLARRPFVNSRPVVRAALALWLLGLLLLLGNVKLFWEYLGSSEDKRADLDKIEAGIEREREVVKNLNATLDGFDLEQQNERVDFLNSMIAERTFSWSLLFDRLAEVQPNDVRLVRLTPLTDDRRQGTARNRRKLAAEQPEKVILSMTAIARSDDRRDESLLAFVDRLYAHPAFDEPNWSRESQDAEEENLSTYEMTVEYIPGGNPRPAAGQPPVVVEELPVEALR
jgi:hypothetical protein